MLPLLFLAYIGGWGIFRNVFISLVLEKLASAHVVQIERKHEHYIHSQPMHSSQQLIVVIRDEIQGTMQWWLRP